MAEKKLYFDKSAIISSVNPNTNYPAEATFDAEDLTKHLVLGLSTFPMEYAQHAITSAEIYCYFTRHDGSLLDGYTFLQPFDPRTITYNNAPPRRGYSGSIFPPLDTGYASIGSLHISDMVRNGFEIYGNPGYSKGIIFHTPNGTYPPYLQLVISDELAEVTPTPQFPAVYAEELTTGKILTRTPHTYGNLYPAHYKLLWKETEGGVVHEFDCGDAGESPQVSIPAGTFLTGSPQIYIAAECTCQTGVAKQSSWQLVNVIAPQLSDLSPSSYAPRNADTQFSWSISASGEGQTPPAQKSATFRWRTSATSGATEIPITGQEQKVIVPKGTFPAGTIQWQVDVVTVFGTPLTSPWTTVSTNDLASSAKAISPKGVIVDAGQDNVFVWEHIVETGSAQTKYELEYSQNGSSWQSLKSESTEKTSAIIPRNTLPGGKLYWRVRTYNSDGTAGSWSESAYCVVIAQPAAPAVSIVRSSPCFAIRWQQSGQEAFEIQLDDQVIAQRFGSESSYVYQGLLPPGLYTVRVRIQSQYGLWSDWGSASLQITNSSGDAITLTAVADRSGVVRLSWQSSQAAHRYQIYRNGKPIGTTTELSYEDHFAIGGAVYIVRGILDDNGNYTESNAVSLRISVSRVQIADVAARQWLALPYTTSDIREASYSASRSVTYQHYVGAALPSAVVGESVSQSIRMGCAFPWSNVAAALKLEAMLGKVVCVKDPRGEQVIGVLESYSKSSSHFWVSYELSITLIDWEEGTAL